MSPVIVEGSACRKSAMFGYMTPDSLERMIIRYRESLPPELVSAMPLGREYQDVLLQYSHFLGIRIREKLLMRLAGHEVFYGPLFYELCDRAGRSTKLQAYERAEEAGNLRAADMLFDALGGDVPRKEKGFFARLAESFLGLAY